MSYSKLSIHIDPELCQNCRGCSHWFLGLPDAAFEGLKLPSWLSHPDNSDILSKVLKLPSDCMHDAMEIRGEYL